MISPMLRGYEKSSLASSYYIIDMAEDVLAIMDVLSVKRAHLVGHDWGSVIGSLLIMHSPDRFASYSCELLLRTISFVRG